MNQNQQQQVNNKKEVQEKKILIDNIFPTAEESKLRICTICGRNSIYLDRVDYRYTLLYL